MLRQQTIFQQHRTKATRRISPFPGHSTIIAIISLLLSFLAIIFRPLLRRQQQRLHTHQRPATVRESYHPERHHPELLRKCFSHRPLGTTFSKSLTNIGVASAMLASNDPKETKENFMYLEFRKIVYSI